MSLRDEKERYNTRTDVERGDYNKASSVFV